MCNSLWLYAQMAAGHVHLALAYGPQPTWVLLQLLSAFGLSVAKATRCMFWSNVCATRCVFTQMACGHV